MTPQPLGPVEPTGAADEQFVEKSLRLNQRGQGAHRSCFIARNRHVHALLGLIRVAARREKMGKLDMEFRQSQTSRRVELAGQLVLLAPYGFRLIIAPGIDEHLAQSP